MQQLYAQVDAGEGRVSRVKALALLRGRRLDVDGLRIAVKICKAQTKQLLRAVRKAPCDGDSCALQRNLRV